VFNFVRVSIIKHVQISPGLDSHFQTRLFLAKRLMHSVILPYALRITSSSPQTSWRRAATGFAFQVPRVHKSRKQRAPERFLQQILLRHPRNLSKFRLLPPRCTISNAQINEPQLKDRLHLGDVRLRKCPLPR
jgi:hypothetical protein